MKNEEAVLAVKFRSTLGHDELVKISNEDLEDFREVPGQVEKYFLTEDMSGAAGGFYIFRSVNEREA